MAIVQLRQVESDENGYPVLSGTCPVCHETRRFTNGAYRKAVNMPLFLLKIMVTNVVGVASPSHWVKTARMIASTRSQAAIACETCNHPVWICGKCSLGFSVAPHEPSNPCANCTTWNC